MKKMGKEEEKKWFKRQKGRMREWEKKEDLKNNTKIIKPILFNR